MATAGDEPEASPPRWHIESYMTSIHDDDLNLTIRRNGKVFYVDVSPSGFVNSPRTTEKYLSRMKLLTSDGDVDEDMGEHTDENMDEYPGVEGVIYWVMEPFEGLLAELAPEPAPGGLQVTLRDYLNPEFFVFALDVVDEELRARRIDMERPPYMPPGVSLRDVLDEGSLSEDFPAEDFHDEGFFDADPLGDDALRHDFFNEVNSWTRPYDPAHIVLSCEKPEDALFSKPRKVLVDDGQTECFFHKCDSAAETLTELRTYKRIAASNLDPDLRIPRLHGIVWDDGRDRISGLLVTYINCGYGNLFNRIRDDPPASLREAWATQLAATLAALHEAGIVWGDVEPNNVLIDRENSVWITNFCGLYTQGWVDPSVAGTVEGDLAGLAKVREFIFHRDLETGMWLFQKQRS